MKIALCHNPTAGNREYSTAHLMKLLRDAGYDPRLASPDDGLEILESLGPEAFMAVAGGDGSIRQMALALAGTGRCLAPIPIGTANNIARSLDIRGQPGEIIAGWSTGGRRKVDMGLAKGPWGRRWFLEGAGAGLIGRTIAVVEEIDAADPREFAGREDKLRRDLSVLIALTHDLPALPLKFLLNGKETAGDYLVVEIMNIAGAGPGLNLAAGTDSSDGYFDLVLAPAADRASLLQRLHACLGRPEHPPILTSIKVPHLTLQLPQGEFRVDDSLVLPRERSRSGEASIEIEMKHHALEFLIPAAVADEAEAERT